MELSNTEDKTGGACGRRGRGGMHAKVLVGNPEGKSPLGRTQRKWEIMLEYALRVKEGRAWNGFVLIRVGKIGSVL
jgi:hypothetical protein